MKPEQLLTTSKITAQLDCARLLTMSHQVKAGSRDPPGLSVGSLAKLLMEKELEHEAAVEASYVDAGLSVRRTGRRCVLLDSAR